MTGQALGLAAIGGGFAALALLEAARSVPWVVRGVNSIVWPLRRAGSEGYAPSSGERRRLGWLAGAALLFLGVWFLGPAPAAPLAAAGPAAASWALAARTRRYRRAVEAALPAIATAAADALAAGRSVRAALSETSGSVEGPAKVEIAQLAADLDLGASLGDALAAFRHRIGSSDLDAFVHALLSQRIGGGDLVLLLRRYSEAGAARQRVRAEAQSATAQARFTGALVAAMPLGSGLLAELVAPGFVAGMVGNGVSLALLVAAASLQLAGFAAIRQLGRVLN